jgi:hypothetical protein
MAEIELRTAKDAQAYLEKLEGYVHSAFQEETNRSRASHSDLEIEMWNAAKEDGFQLDQVRALADSEPSAIGGAISNVVENRIRRPARFLGSSAGEAVVERTDALRTADSSLPALEFGQSALRSSAGAFNRHVQAGGDVLNRVSSAARSIGIPSNAPPIDTNRQVFDTDVIQPFRIGAEQLADTIEIGVPLVGGTASLRYAPTVPTAIAGLVLSSVSGEVGAEYLRVLNRHASGQEQNVARLNDPLEEWKRAGKVALGGVLLGIADVALSKGQLAARKKKLELLFGLGTPESRATVARFARLGETANIGEASTTNLSKTLAKSFSIYPISGGRQVKRGKGIARRLTGTLNDEVDMFAPHGASGLALSGKSDAWVAANDAAIQYNRKAARGSYKIAQSITNHHKDQLGLAGVHVPHHRYKGAVDGIVEEVAGLPLVKKAKIVNGQPRIEWVVPRSDLEKNADYETLQAVMNLGDRVDVIEYTRLRNQVERAVERNSGINDPLGRFFGSVSAIMNDARDHMVAPLEVKNAWLSSDSQWAELNNLLNHSSWRHFKKSGSQFGLADKVGETQTITRGAVLANALNDPNLTPEVIDVWYQTAVRGNSVDVLNDAVHAHFRNVVSSSKSISDKGALEGIEVINWGKLEKSLGLNLEDSTRWESYARLIDRAGGDSAAFKQFIEDAKQAFPLGLPNFQMMATRRVGLGGISSGIRFALGTMPGLGGLGGHMTGSVPGGAIGTAAGAALAMAGILSMRGIGDFMFNPKRLKSAMRIIDGSVTGQSAWKQFWLLARSMGITRNVVGTLQQLGIPYEFAPRTIEDVQSPLIGRPPEQLFDTSNIPPAEGQSIGPIRPGNHPILDPRKR